MISHTNVGGGLANQMFQYAAGLAHAKRMDTDYYYPPRPPHVSNALRSEGLREIFKLSALKIGTYGPLYDESHFGFHYNPMPEVSHLTLHGYFQSEKYFNEYEEDIRKEFTFRNITEFKVPKKTVSIHVRRGDYLSKPEYHPVCSMDYYHKAMREFEGYTFLVITDDKEWCLERFDLPNTQVSLAESAEEDLQRMSLCDHHIIANSSFSWWGAWLNPNKHKRVIAPKKWLGVAYGNYDMSDIYPPGWTIL
tara:strand:- start:4299 stop:5048 length:750 start_codon:yes stop_codon:yes gene_type:complete